MSPKNIVRFQARRGADGAPMVTYEWLMEPECDVTQLQSAPVQVPGIYESEQFTWGSADGRGRDALALAILLRVLDEADDKTVATTSSWMLHQDFGDFLGTKPDRAFTITLAEVDAWLASRKPKA